MLAAHGFRINPARGNIAWRLAALVAVIALPLAGWSLVGRQDDPSPEFHANIEAANKSEYDILANQIADRQSINRFASTTFNPSALIADTDRDPVDIVLRRTQALLSDLKISASGKNWTDMQASLSRLAAREQDRRCFRLGGPLRPLHGRLCSAPRDRVLEPACSTLTQYSLPSTLDAGTTRDSAITCATSTSAGKPCPAVGYSCSITHSARTPRSMTYWRTLS